MNSSEISEYIFFVWDILYFTEHIQTPNQMVEIMKTCPYVLKQRPCLS